MLIRPNIAAVAIAPPALPINDSGSRLFHDAAEPCRRARAIADFSNGLQRWRLALALAWLDIRNRYRGSVLGPFWLTLSTAVMLAGMGFLYSVLFHQTLRAYLPFLTVSLITWNLISQVVSDACGNLIAAEGMIRQLALPYSIHALRCVFRNAITAAHYLPLIMIVLLICRVSPGPGALLALVGGAMIAINALAASMLLGMLCARFRDLSQIVGSIMQIVFFMTPVFWQPSLLGPKAVWLTANPFYVIMEVVRGPLLGTGSPPLVWLSASVFTGLFCVGTFAFFSRFRGRIAFWV